MPSADWEHEWYGELLYRADRWMDGCSDDGDDGEPDDREDRLWEAEGDA